MFVLPPYILLIIYGVFLLTFAFFSLANIIHLLRHGGGNWLGSLAILLYLASSAIVLFVTWQALPALDWTTPIPILQNSII